MDISSLPTITPRELAAHDGKQTASKWVAVAGLVLDVTAYAAMHPGGESTLLEHAGSDVTEAFFTLHRKDVLFRLKHLVVATMQGGDARAFLTTNTALLSSVPYAEADLTVPGYTESHRQFRLAVRRFLVDEGFAAFCESLADDAVAKRACFSPEFASYQKKLGASGLLALMMGPGKHLTMVPEPNLFSQCGLKPEDVDYRHYAIAIQERTRLGCPGSWQGLVVGPMIATNPLLHWGQPWTRDAVVRPIIVGEQRICLAVTEPWAGSDVAGVKTRGVTRADGSFEISGVKKWITGSLVADWFLVLCVLDGNALSLVLLPKQAAVTVSAISTDWGAAALTGLVVFDKAVAPANCLIGRRGEGLKMTLANFNMERLGICADVIGFSRRIVEDCWLWAAQRKVGGKRLLDVGDVKLHLAEMTSLVEACQAMLDATLHKYAASRDPSNEMGGPTAMLKFRATRMSCEVYDRACQVMGGRSCTKTGMGKLVNRYQSFKVLSIGGGSEGVMVDLAVKQAAKKMPQWAKL